MLFWVVTIALGVALGMLIGSFLLAVFRIYEQQITQISLWVALVGYIVLVYLGFSQGWFRAGFAWLLARILAPVKGM